VTITRDQICIQIQTAHIPLYHNHSFNLQTEPVILPSSITNSPPFNQAITTNHLASAVILPSSDHHHLSFIPRPFIRAHHHAQFKIQIAICNYTITAALHQPCCCSIQSIITITMSTHHRELHNPSITTHHHRTCKQNHQITYNPPLHQTITYPRPQSKSATYSLSDQSPRHAQPPIQLLPSSLKHPDHTVGSPSLHQARASLPRPPKPSPTPTQSASTVLFSAGSLPVPPSSPHHGLITTAAVDLTKPGRRRLQPVRPQLQPVPHLPSCSSFLLLLKRR
jgi:hypothetical protein